MLNLSFSSFSTLDENLDSSVIFLISFVGL